MPALYLSIVYDKYNIIKLLLDYWSDYNIKLINYTNYSDEYMANSNIFTDCMTNPVLILNL